MKVSVHLHSTLMVETPEGPRRRLEVDLQGGSTIMDLIRFLDLEIAPDSLLLGINGEVARLDDQIHAGDHVHLMLPISGGMIGNNSKGGIDA